MFRQLALLCAIVTPALGLFEVGFQTTFGVPLTNSAYFAMPKTLQEALDAGYVEMPRAKNETGYEECYLMCLTNDVFFCVLIDATNRTAGAQIALDIDRYSNSTYDLCKQGFTLWNVTVNGVDKTYLATQQYYISTETLKLSVEARLARHNDSVFLQDEGVWVTGFNGDLYRIPTNVTNMADTNFTKQACIPLMGRHFFYNMTNNTECSAETLLPYFVLTYDDQLVGVGLIVPGVYNLPDGMTQYYETPGLLGTKLVLTDGPECLFQLASSPGFIAIHFYFIKYPILLTCIGE